MILLHMLLVLNLPHKASRTVIPLFFLLALLGIGVGAVIVVAAAAAGAIVVVDLGRIVSALLSHGPEFDLIVPRGFPFRFGIIVQGHDGMNGWKQGAHCRRFRGWRRGWRRGAAKGNSTFTVVLVRVVAMVVGGSWRWCGPFVGSASSYPPGGGFHQCDGDGRVVLALLAAAVRKGKGVSRQGIGRRRGERGRGRSRTTRMSALVAATATVGTPRVV